MTEQPDQRLHALAAWFSGEHVPLVRFATLICGDEHLALDLVQEAFIRSYAAGARPEPGFGAYARKAILSVSRSRFRRLASESRAYAHIGEPSEAFVPEERDWAIWTALMRLPTQQRAVLGLRFYEDLSELEIARVLGISPGTVKKHVQRGVARLRDLLGDDAR